MKFSMEDELMEAYAVSGWNRCMRMVTKYLLNHFLGSTLSRAVGQEEGHRGYVRKARDSKQSVN
jgi:hypothetical protein